MNACCSDCEKALTGSQIYLDYRGRLVPDGCAANLCRPCFVRREAFLAEHGRAKLLRSPHFESLWVFLMRDPMKLHSDIIDALIQATPEFGELLRKAEQNVLGGGLAVVKRYRLRKAELARLPAEKLEEMDRERRRRRAEYLAQDNDYDPLPDSAFEGPSLDSDEHIVYELVEERRRAKLATASAPAP